MDARETRKQAFSLPANLSSSKFHKVQCGERTAWELHELSTDRDRTEVDPREVQLGDQCANFGLRPRLVSRVEEDAGSTLSARITREQMRREMVERLYDTGAWNQVGEHSVDSRPLSSAGWKRGRSIELLASITMRPAQSGRSANAFGSFDHGTATSTRSALAASSTVPAVMCGVSSRTKSRSVSGPRLFAIVAAIPICARARANAAPISPAPMMPIDVGSLQVGLLIRR